MPSSDIARVRFDIWRSCGPRLPYNPLSRVGMGGGLRWWGGSRLLRTFDFGGLGPGPSDLDPARCENRVVTSGRLRCLFCYATSGDSTKLSAEHLLSRPVADAFGVDRTSSVARFGREGSDVRWGVLNGIKRTCVCTQCNSEWMNRLEHRMTAVAEWLRDTEDEPLGSDRERTLRQWAIKTHILLCYIEGNASNFGSDRGPAVVPPVTTARQLFEGDAEALRRSAVGVSISSSATRFAWSFGSPQVRPALPAAPGLHLLTPASVLTLGVLQLWIVAPILEAEVVAPTGVMNCHPHLRRSDLLDLDHPLTVEGITVTFAETSLLAVAETVALAPPTK